MQTPDAGLGKGFFHDPLGQFVNFDVHLESGNPFTGAGHFKVHITVMILIAENIGQDRDVVVIFDQAHGNTRDRGFYRDPAVHEGQAGCTHGTHG